MQIIVNMACGLANRMFQYSYYRFLKKNGFNAVVDFYHSARLTHENVAWNNIFPNAGFEQASTFKVKLLGGGGGCIARFRRKVLPALTGVVTMPTAFDYYNPHERTNFDKYIIGVFQNAEMVNAVEAEIKEAFVFTPFHDEYNNRLADEIQSCESVAIHVRKGKDYMQRIWYKGTCTMDYYLRAVACFKEHLQNPRFYVFTDNAAWVKENFIGFNYTLVDGNPGAGWGSHYDMQLMSLCRHNIISNSTYSWWGAYLNDNAGKIVIAPDMWFNPGSCEEYHSQRALCHGWMAL